MKNWDEVVADLDILSLKASAIIYKNVFLNSMANNYDEEYIVKVILRSFDEKYLIKSIQGAFFKRN